MSPPLTAFETARLCREGHLTPVEAVRAALDRVDRVDPRLRAVLHLDRKGAIRRAERLAASGPPPDGAGLLYGVPIFVKDNICVREIPVTCGSRILSGYRPTFDATVIERITAQGGIVLGTANMDEFGMGSSTEHSARHVTLNPWGTGLSPGGSSGGSAALVAARVVPLALGTDTGGSIRQPAALCGTVGFKPTYGTVSRFGLVAFASSLDQIGPLANTVLDAALLYQVLAGHDPRDSTSIPGREPDILARIEEGTTGLRIGVPESLMEGGIEPPVAAAVRGALDILEREGAEIRSVELPHAGYAVPAYYLVASSEASSNLARYDGVRYGPRWEDPDGNISPAAAVAATRGAGFGSEVKRRIMLGTFALSAGYHDAYYLKAQKVRRLVQEDFMRAFGEVDVIAAPTSPVAAIRIGEKVDSPVDMYRCDVLTAPASMAGIPALSIPCGLTEGVIPLSLQLMGPALADGRVLRAARAFERVRPQREFVPPVAATSASASAEADADADASPDGGTADGP